MISAGKTEAIPFAMVKISSTVDVALVQSPLPHNKNVFSSKKQHSSLEFWALWTMEFADDVMLTGARRSLRPSFKYFSAFPPSDAFLCATLVALNRKPMASTVVFGNQRTGRYVFPLRSMIVPPSCGATPCKDCLETSK